MALGRPLRSSSTSSLSGKPEASISQGCDILTLPDSKSCLPSGSPVRVRASYLEAWAEAENEKN